MKAKEGMRVMVRVMGYVIRVPGTITKVEPLVVEMESGRKEVLVEDYPAEITLDDGRKTEGLDCWWTPIEDTYMEE